MLQKYLLAFFFLLFLDASLENCFAGGGKYRKIFCVEHTGLKRDPSNFYNLSAKISLNKSS